MPSGEFIAPDDPPLHRTETATHPTSIDRSEWLAADHGVALVTADGLRWWQAWSDGVVARTTPTPSPDRSADAVGVSRRLVEYAAALAVLGHDVTLTVDGSRVAARTSQASLVTERTAATPDEDTPFSPRGGDTVARVEAELLGHLLEHASHLPVGVDIDDPDLPIAYLALAEGRVSVFVDWGRVGVPRSDLTVAAEVDGPDALTVVSLARLARVLRFVDPAEVVGLWVDHAGDHLGIATADWAARLATAPTGLARLAATVDATLRHVPDATTVTRSGERAWQVVTGSAAVSVEVLGPQTPAVRAATVLVGGVAPTLAVLGELNALTAGLAGARVFWQAGAVIAAVDVAADAVDDHLVAAIGGLLAQTDQLGPLVAALGADE